MRKDPSPGPKDRMRDGFLRLFHERHVTAELEAKTSSTRLCDANRRTSLFQPAPQQDEPAFQVVFDVGQAEGLVQPQSAVRKLYRPTGMMFMQELPQDFRRQSPHQVFAIDEDALVTFEVLHLYLPAAA